MHSELIDKTDTHKIGVAGKKFVNLIIYQNMILCIFQLHFVRHFSDILLQNYEPFDKILLSTSHFKELIYQFLANIFFEQEYSYRPLPCYFADCEYIPQNRWHKYRGKATKWYTTKSKN